MKIELSKKELNVIKEALQSKFSSYERMENGYANPGGFHLEKKEINNLVAVIDVFLTRVADES